MQELAYSKPGVGTVRLLGDPDEGQEFKVKDVTFGEYVDLSGHVHGPLTKRQCHGIMALAGEEWQALAIVEHG
jgi:hypothetical protein